MANRGEIAIRAFRAATEMGIATVAVYPYEGRNSPHRLKADGFYQIGGTGHPVRAYLSVAEIIRVAQLAGADAVYPEQLRDLSDPGCRSIGRHMFAAERGCMHPWRRHLRRRRADLARTINCTPKGWP